MNYPAHKTEGVTRTQTMRFYPSSFTGKERDEETGYGYFGARYMDHELLTMWLSVDPMADKYPGISPYAYCAWAPVKLVDPDGKEVDDYFSKDGKYLGTDNAKTDNIRIIDEARWNELSENGIINHDVGYENSKSFSSAHTEMTQKSQLEVYQHYNPTKCQLYAASSKGNPGQSGMITTTEGKKSKIGIYLEANYKGIAVSDHANEITNMLAHEEQHLKDHKTKAFVFDYEYENSAFMTQFNHSSWQKCRPEFRRNVTNYAREVSTLPEFVLDFWDPSVTQF